MSTLKRSFPILLVFVLLTLTAVHPAAAQGGEILVVNSNASEPTGSCDPSPGTCTFQDALNASDAMDGVQTIEFNIGGGGVQSIITPLTAHNNLSVVGFLVQNSVIIDATTQPGYNGKPLIQILPAIPTGNGRTENGIFISNTRFQFDANLSVTVKGFAIDGFTGSGGLCLCNGHDNVAEDNYIGVDPDGVTPDGNLNGILVSSSNNIIQNNVISGSTDAGIAIKTNAGNHGDNNTVIGNFIGTDYTGTVAIPNLYGVTVREAATGNVIGGTTPAERNIISGNLQWGIFTDGNDQIATENANHTTIIGNYIGTDVTGTVALGNGHEGIFIQRSDDNTVGGTDGTTPGGACTGACNLISANASAGIAISEDSLGTAQNNVIEGNYIGTDVTGTAALPNLSGGISIGARDNLIGGTTAGTRNVISGNHSNGILIAGFTTFGNAVLGNIIGADTTGTQALGNQGAGIYISGAAYANQIGDGTDDGTNIIAFNGSNNGQPGIGIDSGTVNGFYADQNLISGNSIFGNYGLGIDLGNDGVTPNDLGDRDVGGDELQNYPVLTNVVTRATTVITGSLSDFANHDYRVELFANVHAACDASGHGEGEVYLGGAAVTTDDHGNVSFQITVDPPAPPGADITATSIDNDSNSNSVFIWNSSEFSNCVSAQADLSLTKSDSPDPVIPGDTLTYTLTVSNPVGGSYADNIDLTDVLPAGLSYVSGSSTAGSCTYTAGTRTVDCPIPLIQNGSSVTATITTTVDANITTASITNTAHIASDTTDPVTTNNTATQKTTVSSANLGVTITPAPAAATVDGYLTYTMNVANSGPNAATNVSLNDTLPANITFVAATPSQGTCTPGSGTVACSLGSIAKGSTATVSIIVQPLPNAQGTIITDSATVSATEVDTALANNTATASVKVNASTGIPLINFFTTSTPTFTWNPTAGATTYEVEVDDNTAFSSPDFDDDTIPGTTLVVTTTTLHDGPWYWRVRAMDSSGHWGAWSAATPFVIDTP